VVHVEARPSCELLDWDSEHFGFPIARLRGSRLDEASAAEVDEWSRARAVRCLYFLADPEHAETTDVARAHGFAPVDVRLTLRHDRDPLPEVAPAVAIREARPEDASPLRRLAARSHHVTSYYGGVARMELLAIDEAHHGKGLGRALLSSELRRAESCGASAVETAIQESNARALRGHLTVGFTPIRREVWHHKWFER
jgi:GNAT superfamily N-acetyltransferase